MIIAYSILLLAFFTSCRKELISDSVPDIDKPWEHFIGKYNVYDTLGTFLYELEIIEVYNNPNISYNYDSLRFINFADSFSFTQVYNWQPLLSENFDISIGIHQPIDDSNGKRWHLSTLLDDVSTSVPENTLFNDTIIFYFKMDNIAYYMADAVPYYSCNCKHIAVKQ